MPTHSWRFRCIGGVNQVILDSSDDLRHLAELDPKLWVALAMPTAGVELDAATLALLDADGDGRIRQPDVLAGVALVVECLRDPGMVFTAGSTVAAVDLRTDSERAARVQRAALLIGEMTGRPGGSLDSAEFPDAASVFRALRDNGDGVIVPSGLADAVQADLAREAVAFTGGTPDRGGETGLSAGDLDRFVATCAELRQWREAEGGHSLPGVPDLEAALAALDAVEAKIDDYFLRQQFLSFDPRSAEALDPPAFDTVAPVSIVAGDQWLARPLARLVPGGPLPMATGVNPAWRQRIHQFRSLVVMPTLGVTEELTEPDWLRLKDIFAPLRAWLEDGRRLGSIDLGPDTIAQALDADHVGALRAAMARDLAADEHCAGIPDLVALLRLRTHLARVLRNFVNFEAFYDRVDPGAFVAGRLYLDQRSCDLVVPVLDGPRHAAMAGRSGSFLAYLDCTRRVDGRQLAVCAAVTDGDSDNLMVGRNGVFFDRAGRDYDATVTRVVENPISIRQAFWAPYKRAVRAVEDYAAKRAAEAETTRDAALAGQATAAVSTGTTPAPTAKLDIGTLAAIGVAVGGVTAALGALLDAVFGLGYLMPLGVVALLLCVSGPSMLIAALKLRRRNLGPLLDADGWALNTQARINVPFGRSLTRLASLPPGSHLSVGDPYAERRSLWPRLALVAIVLAALAALLARSGWLA